MTPIPMMMGMLSMMRGLLVTNISFVIPIASPPAMIPIQVCKAVKQRRTTKKIRAAKLFPHPNGFSPSVLVNIASKSVALRM